MEDGETDGSSEEGEKGTEAAIQSANAATPHTLGAKAAKLGEA